MRERLPGLQRGGYQTTNATEAAVVVAAGEDRAAALADDLVEREPYQAREGLVRLDDRQRRVDDRDAIRPSGEDRCLLLALDPRRLIQLHVLERGGHDIGEVQHGAQLGRREAHRARERDNPPQVALRHQRDAQHRQLITRQKGLGDLADRRRAR